MRIGLLSDSHGRVEATRRGAAALVEAGADLLLHLGDIGAPEVLDALVLDSAPGGPRPVRIVFGNVDLERRQLVARARSLGITVDDPVGRLTLAGRTVVFQHGHLEAEMAAAVREGVAYLCHGHTHAIRDERLGPTRVINPGALFRARQHTVALLDTVKDQVRFVAV